MARSMQLLKSPEFQQQNVYGHVQEVRNALRCVIDNPASLQREVFCWAAASFLLNDRGVFYDGVLVLLQSKRLPEDVSSRVGVATPEGIAFLYGFQSKSIQQYVVLPYLKGEIK